MTTSIDISNFWEIDPREWEEIKEMQLWNPTHASTPSKIMELATAASICRWYNNLKKSELPEGISDKPSLLETIHNHPKVTTNKSFHSKNLRVFQRKFTAYKREGVKGLIDRRQSNTNALKLRTVQQKKTLVRLYASHHNRDAVWVAEDYNKVAKLNKWPEISERTVREFISKEANLEAELFRNGISNFKSKVLPINQRQRPERPGYCWEGDGTPWELYYQAIDQNGKKTYWNRKVVYVVSDAFNDLPVGWAIGERENAALIREAFKNAIINTGMLPWQIRVDNFAKSSLKSTYEAISKWFTPTAPGNAKAKLIEQMFSRFSSTRILKKYDNWSGCNITNRSESNQPNREFLQSQVKNFPNEEEVIQQINDSLNEFRNSIIKKDGLVRFDSWINALKDTNKIRKASIQTVLDVFGVYRDQEHPNNTYEFTNEGITMIIQGQEYHWQEWEDENVFEELYGARDLRVKYLPEDLNVIRVDHSGRGKSYYLKIDKALPGCVMDMLSTPGSREEYLKRVSFHKRLIGSIIQKHKQTIAITDEAMSHMNVDAEGILKSMFTVDGGNKQYLNDAKGYLKKLDNNITEKDNEGLYDDDLIMVSSGTNEDDELYDDF